MNNLAIMLDDVLQQMQMSMAEAMGQPGSEQQQSMPLPSLGEMQQELGDQIQQIGEDGKSGRQLSEELARMAAEQEMIRQQLQEMREQLSGQPGNEGAAGQLGEAIRLMEQNELDLVNKRITQQLMSRQQQIVTRMLQAEDALKEQEQDHEREGETANPIQRRYPPGYEEYLEKRKKEIELLRSVPLNLNPFYKKEVNDYFRRLSESE